MYCVHRCRYTSNIPWEKVGFGSIYMRKFCIRMRQNYTGPERWDPQHWSYPGCPVPALRLTCPAPAFLSLLSCPRCRVLIVLSYLFCHRCPVPISVLSRLSCPGHTACCPIKDFMAINWRHNNEWKKRILTKMFVLSETFASYFDK
jgi:hypothetical protein